MDRYRLKKGFNKVFIGELFSFLSSFINYGLVILSTWAISSMAKQEEIVKIGLIVVIGGALVMIISFIGLLLSILGIRQIKEEDASFQKAFLAMFMMIISAVVASFVTKNEDISFVVNEIPQVINVVVLFYLLKGIQSLMMQMQQPTKNMNPKIGMIITCFTIVCIGDLLVHFLSLSVFVLMALACILLIGYILLLSELMKIKRQFKEK